MEIVNESPENNKQRHGCVTAWLVFMIVVNSVTALVYLFGSKLIAGKLTGSVPPVFVSLLGIAGVANVIFSVQMMQWKKSGFKGFVVSSVCAMAINLLIGVGLIQSLLGLLGIAILYGILQISKDGVSAWDNLKE